MKLFWLSLLASVCAEDIEIEETDNDLQSSKPSESATPEPEAPEVDIPYEIPQPDVFFLETFSKPLNQLDWVVSNDDKFKDGDWEIGRGPQKSGGIKEQGLLVKGAAKHHAISRLFSAPFSAESQDLVIQYEVRFHQAHSCGGAYIKLLKYDPKFLPENFKDSTDYVIMFGPDKCGETDKVHFIFRHQNPISKEFEEKHLVDPPKIKNDLLTHLYTLIVRTDNTFDLLIDQKSVRKGSLLKDFNPPVNPPATIDDPTDSKPSDWVDEKKIRDPKAVKPDDWDESEPATIVDLKAKKPSGWLDDEPANIPDPDAVKPEDWDESDDGEWEAPLIPNPKCKVGCGAWEAPKVSNPKYKGKWVAPLIDNPAYKGEWKPRQLPNPNYFLDNSPHKFTPMGGVGIEIWTMQDDIEFDNVLVESSAAAARAFAQATWQKKHDAQKKALPPAPEDPNDRGVLDQLQDVFNAFLTAFSENPVPYVVSVVVGAITISVLCYMCLASSDSPTAPDVPATEAEEEEEKKEEAQGEGEAEADGEDKDKDKQDKQATQDKDDKQATQDKDDKQAKQSKQGKEDKAKPDSKDNKDNKAKDKTTIPSQASKTTKLIKQ